MALLVLASVRDPRWACVYLLVFGVGTLVGMTLITTGIATPVTLASRRWTRFGGSVRLATGLISFSFGIWLIYETGFRDGLFLSAPHWVPH